ncbi:MAG: hypothetical protein JW864_08830 [Spirochaetes bacterium]|nr:hypothetical protein [Spirochaetota bacterium]
MKSITRLFLILLVAAGFAFMGCSSDDDDSTSTGNPVCTPNVFIPSNLSAPAEWIDADGTTEEDDEADLSNGDTGEIGDVAVTYADGYWEYDLTGETCIGIIGSVQVQRLVKLIIPAGATVVADTTVLSYISVQQEGAIEAIGTASAPIVFTSGASVGSRSSSDWGGIVIHGQAKCNTEAGVNTASNTEIGTGAYGGDVNSDSSGTLQYVRVEFAGYEIATAKEFNGIFLAGVGSGTTIDHVQVHRGSDDGIEIFGGTVSPSYCVLTYNDDDGFDLDDGWSGVAKNFVIAKGATVGDSFIEYDGTGADDNRPTQSFFANFTFLGQGEGKKNTAINIKKEGALVVINSLFANITDQGIVHQGETNLGSGAFNTAFYEDVTHTGLTDTNGEGTYSGLLSNRFENVVFGAAVASTIGNVIYNAEDLSTTVNKFDADIIANNEFSAAMSFTAPASYWGENGSSDFQPAATAAVTTTYTTAITSFSGVVLTPADYVGAIDPAGANWMDTWTAFPAN